MNFDNTDDIFQQKSVAFYQFLILSVFLNILHRTSNAISQIINNSPIHSLFILEIILIDNLSNKKQVKEMGKKKKRKLG